MQLDGWKQKKKHQIQQLSSLYKCINLSSVYFPAS
jgi:hypothetical protein